MKIHIPLYGAVASLCLMTALAQPQNQNQNLGRLQRADKVYGKEVMSSDNQKIGNLNNLVVDLESGRILYAVVAADSGRVAVPPQIFTQTPSAEQENLRAKVTKQKIESAPKFGDYDKPADLGKAEFISQVYQHFGQNTWWQGSGQAANVGSFNNVHKASKVIGMKVENVSDADMGKVENLMVDLPAGRVTYVILSPSSRLNLGDNNLYALPPDALTLSKDGDNLVSDIDQAKLSSAPHFAKNSWTTLSDPSFASRVYQHYGKQAYFEGSLRPTGR